MKKIAEIDPQEILEKTQLRPSDEDWLEQVFSKPQQKFLIKHHCVGRRHPKNSFVLELFVDEQKFTERDWTMLRLLFS